MKRRREIIFIIIGGIALALLLAAGVMLMSGIFKDDDIDKIPEAGERITVAEAGRLFSYLYYDKSEREALDGLLSEEQYNSYGWSSTYINALANAGVVTKDSRLGDLHESLECTLLREFLLKISETLEIDYKKILEGIPERALHTKEGETIYLEDFIKMYTHILELADGKAKTELVEDKIFVLGVVESSRGDKELQVITDDNKKYYGTKFQNYTDLFEEDIMPPEFKVETTDMRSYPKLYDYLDCYLEVLRCGNEIVYIKAISDEAVVLKNVWMLQASDMTAKAFANGVEREFTAKGKLSESVYTKICDVTIQNAEIVSIKVKPDIVKGKVLLTGDEEIEIDGLGKVALDENFKIYKIYDELEMERTSSILVGYSNTDFVIEDGKICAALIKEKLKAENIRVLISVGNNTEYYHESVELSVDRDFIIENLGGKENYKSGTVLTFDKDSELLKYGRLRITPVSENGKTKIASIKRAYGTPSYRGSIEIAVTDEGLVVINELSIEEYLYTVVPSEMPNSYGEEALKVQAICARSFAFSQLLTNRYSSYGAHVDDTVNCQVYNNVKETDSSVYAVKDTYGKVIEYDDEIVTAYYFSTSCGYTADAHDVWENYGDIEYYTGALQADNMQKDVLGDVNLENEEQFQNFILTGKLNGSEVEIFDDSFSWYRWNVFIDTATLSERINKKVEGLYNSNNKYIQTLVEGDGSITTPSGLELKGEFKSIPVTSVGEVQHIEVLKRGESGIVKELLIVGSEATIKAMYQTYVRTLLAPEEETVYLQNEVTVNGFSLLPSAYCFAQKEENGFTFIGGGYGHGVGMSQNGVKGMVDAGYEYEDILTHYYNGIELGFIYE